MQAEGSPTPVAPPRRACRRVQHGRSVEVRDEQPLRGVPLPPVISAMGRCQHDRAVVVPIVRDHGSRAHVAGSPQCEVDLPRSGLDRILGHPRCGPGRTQPWTYREFHAAPGLPRLRCRGQRERAVLLADEVAGLGCLHPLRGPVRDDPVVLGLGLVLLGRCCCGGQRCGSQGRRQGCGGDQGERARSGHVGPPGSGVRQGSHSRRRVSRSVVDHVPALTRAGESHTRD
jgi:hypothetical protein